MTEGPPLRLMIDPNAKPVAFHTPVPVPLHWQEDVKAGLDQDVQLGVIEPVPVGDHVTWCHRMVICAKKNGNPRRTVDLQPLNSHAIRETHHTQSSTKPDSYHRKPRRQYSIVGMVTTACHYTLMTGTSPHLSPPGEDTATRLPPRVHCIR